MSIPSGGSAIALRLWAARVVVLAAAVPLAAGACVVTTKQGARMQAETAELRARIDQQAAREAESKEQLERLRKVLDQATALLTRNSADVGAQVQKTQADLADLTGKIAEAQHVLDGLSRQVAEDRARLGELQQVQAQMQAVQQKVVDRVAPTMPEDKEQLWAAAKGKLDGGYWEDARRFYRSFIQRFPQDPRAPQGHIQVGAAYAAEKKFPLASGEYQKVLDSYPRAPEVPEAMWQLASTFVEMKFCGDARALLADLAKRYPRSPQAAQVKDRVKALDRILKDKDKCTS